MKHGFKINSRKIKGVQGMSDKQYREHRYRTRRAAEASARARASFLAAPLKHRKRVYRRMTHGISYKNRGRLPMHISRRMTHGISYKNRGRLPMHISRHINKFH